jgi:predicted nucleic-acid-binding Zn-ribbon protein
MDINSKGKNMKKIIDIIVNSFKTIFNKKSRKSETEEVIEPKVKRLTYSKRTDI